MTNDHHPGFKRFIDESGLLFRGRTQFRKANLEEWQEVHRRLPMQMWSPERLAQDSTS
jgi:hypothetical protein